MIKYKMWNRQTKPGYGEVALYDENGTRLEKVEVPMTEWDDLPGQAMSPIDIYYLTKGTMGIVDD